MTSRELNKQEVADIVARTCPADTFRGKKVLLIVPDATRTAPVGLLFKAIHAQIRTATKNLDVMIALGTHQPMSEAAICERLELTLEQRKGAYASVTFFNHAWNDPSAL